MVYTRILAFLMPVFCFGLSHVSAQNVDEWKAQLDDSDQQKKLVSLHHLNATYNQIALDTAVIYGREALAIAKELQLDSLIGVSYARLSLSFYYQRQMDSLVNYAQQGEEIAARGSFEKLQAYCLKMEAIGHKNKGDFDEAIACNERGLAIYEVLQDTNGMAGIYSNIGQINNQKGVYDQALSYFLQAEQLFEKINDINGRSVTAAQIGDLYLGMREQAKGIHYTKKALSLTDRDSLAIRYGDLLNTLGTIYHTDETKLDSAVLCFSESLALFEKIGDTEGMAISHTHLGSIYRDQGQWQKAFLHLHQGISLKKEMGGEPDLTHNYKDFGAAHELAGQVDSAEHYYLKAYEASKETVIMSNQEKVLESLYLFYKKQNNAPKALHFHELFVAHLEEKKGEAVQKEIAALEEKYEAEKRDREIERLELQSAVEVSKTNALRIGLLALGIVAFLIIAGILYRRRNEQKLFLLQQKMHEQEKKELDQELNFKTKQLTSHALHMVQKNEVLQELKKGISDLTKGSDAVQKKALKSLIRRIDFNIQSDEDWDTFKLYFEQTNQNFYENLAKINKDLTSTELKLCSLIKLNMNIKETASVLNIEPTSVKTARHRLRKKLQLQQGQDLTSFIRQVA